MSTSRIWFRASLLGLLGVAVVGSTLALAARRDGTDFYRSLDPLVDVRFFIEQRFVEEITPDKARAMENGAIQGMIEALGDPYTAYVPPADKQEFTKQLTGQYVGIGAQVNTQNGWLTIVSPLEGTPAYDAGLMAEDRVVEIDGESTFGKPVEECVERLMGEPGKPVTIIVERAGQRLEPITIVRQHIVARSIAGVHRHNDQGGAWDFTIDADRRIGYIRIAQFTPTAAREFAEALDTLGAARGDLKGLVIDVRWNPGGLLDAAIDIADMFLADGVIVSTRGRAVPEEVTRARDEGTLPDFPVAILINGQSASASEVLAGALVENGRAVAIGTRSFGKGSVQALFTLERNGAQLKITEQHYYLPSGRLLHRTEGAVEWGVDPSPGFYVPMTERQAVEMLRVRREEEIIRSGDAAQAAERDKNWSDPAWILDHLKDQQLAAAVQAVQLRIEAGEWRPTGQEVPAGAALAAEELQAADNLRERLIREIDKINRRIEALTNAAGDARPPEEPDFWPDDLDLDGATVQVLDKDGKPVATLRVPTARWLERALIDAGAESQAAPAPRGE